LLFLGLVSDTRNLGFNLEDLVVSLLDQLLDGLKGLVSLLHAKETLLPVLKKGLLAHDNTFNFDSGLLECVTGGSCLFLLGDELGLVKCLLFIKALDLLIHGIDEQILLLLGLFEVANVLFSAVSSTTSDSDLTLHDLVVFFDLLKGTIELVKLLLGFEHTFQLLVGLFLLAFVLALKDLVLALSLGSVALDDVVVIVSALESSLHARQLMLDAIELHTSFFTGHADFAH